METIFFTRALLALLAIALVVAAVGDWRRRLIENWLTGGIALSSPLLWVAQGYGLWPDVGVQVLLALGLFLFFLIFFALGAMGGGDVKLIAALGLWFPLGSMMNLLVIMSILGGILTLAMLIHHRIARKPGRPEIPYGIAISAAGLWIIFQTIS
jgi:prepilin peptidase CpaA